MKAAGYVGLLLLAIVALAGAGCAHGSGLELGGFGSSLDSDDLGNGYGGGAKLELNPIDMFSVDARAGFIHFDNADVDMVPLEATGVFNFGMVGERIVPYVGAGVGYYFFDADDADLNDEVGFFPLVGLEVGLHRVSVLLEARWLFLETDVDRARAELEDLIEAEIDGLGVNVGLLLRF